MLGGLLGSVACVKREVCHTRPMARGVLLGTGMVVWVDRWCCPSMIFRAMDVL